MAFIIDSYNRYDQWNRDHARYIFEINGHWYAVYWVQMEWGLPRLPFRIDGNGDPKQYFVYNTYEEAMEFVHRMKRMN